MYTSKLFHESIPVYYKAELEGKVLSLAILDVLSVGYPT